MDGETCDFADLYECQGILRFHAYIRRMLEKGQDVDDLAEKLMRRKPRAVGHNRDERRGYGIVAGRRLFAGVLEAAGRVCTVPRLRERKRGLAGILWNWNEDQGMMKSHLIRHSITVRATDGSGRYWTDRSSLCADRA
ncbi:MAG: hypothetical protein ACLTLQ_00545 [[Clostridium] scindens]